MVTLPAARNWKFLSNHAQVLLCIAGDRDMRLRDIGEQVGITERATHHIVDELVAAGYVARSRRGRRNQYAIAMHLPLADPVVGHQKVGDLLRLLSG